MVDYARTYGNQLAARYVVRSLGVPDELLAASEAANPELDWDSVVHALDGVFLQHGGSMAQLSFLRSPQDGLDGQTPLEALVEAGGPSRVCIAARAFADSANAGVLG